MKLKKTFLLLGLIVALFSNSYSQTSDMGFSFQGYAIDPDGKALASTAITVKFTLTPGTFTEEHLVITDGFGVFHAIVGNSSPAKKLEFKQLDFTAKGVIYTLKVEVMKTTGGVYTSISNAPMNAVPYARYAFNGVPVGTIVAYGGDKNKVPEGWLLCDGQSVAQNAYPQLFAVIGTAWGSSGASFNLPDMRGRFLRGVNDGATNDPDGATRVVSNVGGNSGNLVGSLQTDEIKTHNHTNSTDGLHDHRTTTTRDEGFLYIDGTNTDVAVDADPGLTQTNNLQMDNFLTSGNHTHTITNTGGSETRPTNVAVYYIVKY